MLLEISSVKAQFSTAWLFEILYVSFEGRSFEVLFPENRCSLGARLFWKDVPVLLISDQVFRLIA